MPDYQKGKIYKLVSDHTDEIYIGSTCQLLCHRLSQHARDFREGKNKCTCKNMFELGKVKIVLIENVPCDSKEELYKRERHYIETMDCVNKLIPGRTVAENYQDKKEHFKKKSMDRYHAKKEEILKQHKEYRLKNIDTIKERRKLRTICDCGLDVNKEHIAQHKRTKRHLNLMESKTEVPIDAIHL